MNWRALFKPSAKYSIIVLILVGVVAGVVGYFATQQTLHATSQDAFCMTCHSHHSLKDEVLASAHGGGRAGVTVQCQDCHLPHGPVDYLIKKIIVSKDLYGFLTIKDFNTQKWLDENRREQADTALAYFKATDSANCQHCHTRIYENQPDTMKRMAKMMHSRNAKQEGAKRKTCIDCHKGVAHPYPKK
ncbi:NapC/NirT family cytochrome c [Shewanella intestini]|uniref:Cytochrome c-type protein n=1 Tax=Shewanella intestini TaxID=2017544 RepID=A0ABS5I3Z4_9GAMM|nr:MULTISPECIES: NapC/NirT family cytochrome c [Shewanella]MBR9728749.1 cytochrome C [Shewanella intestini]MRG36824.1 cytochrome C [Shewanella sp. XMDDZSB0408]